MYIFGFATGGKYPSTSFTQGQVATVTNSLGNLAAALAITSANSDSYTTQTQYYVIGGVGVSGFSTYTQSFGSNASGDPVPSASDSFTVTKPGSLVVVVGLSADEQAMSLSGISGLSTDAQSSDIKVTIAHAYLNPGGYTVTETTQRTAFGQTPGSTADLIGVFVFSP